MDCAFLVTAWNKAALSQDEEKELQEHRLLSQVLQILLRNPKIPDHYLSGLLKGQEPDLPMLTAQKVGLPEPVEFWNALGSPLRPSINCVVTISVDLKEGTTIPTVKSHITRYEQQGEPGSFEEIKQVGNGEVVTADPAKIPVLKIRDIGKEYSVRLQEEGIDTVAKLLALSQAELARILKKGGTKSLRYYKTKAANILEAAQKELYDREK